jgi:ATP-dependent Clp protease, protease subunit
MEGHIYIDGVIDSEFHKEVKRQIAALGNVSRLIVHIQSPGGSVYAGYNTYHVLKSSGKPITTIIEGEAQSMATFIALAGDKIEIKNPSVYMIHNPSQGLQGDADTLQGGADELRKIENEMIQAYSVKTKLPEDQIREMMRKETRMTANEAKQYGFVDEVTNYLKAVAIGKKMTTETKEEKNILDKILDKLDSIGKKTGAKAEGPTAIDLPLQAGGNINVEGDGTELKGKPATVNGAAAPDGEYPLSDGRVLVVAAGVVSDVREAMTEDQKALKAAQEKIAALEAQNAQKAAAEQAAQAKLAEAQQQSQQAATALAEIKADVEKFKSLPAGDQSKPFDGMTPHRQPAAMGGPSARQKQIESTVRFLNEYMPWLKQYYPEGHFEKYASGPNMVSILETNFNYTYPGILTTEIFYKPTLQAPALSDIFTIDQGIKDRKRYNLVTQLDKILKPYTGCDRQFNGNRQFITNATVQTKEFNVAESWCKDDFTRQLEGSFNHLAQEWLKTGNKSFDPSGTPINTVIDRILTDALQRDVFRRVSFAAGNSSDNDYNQFDGLWDRLIDSSGGSNYCVVRAGSALGTGSLAAGAALTALEAVYANSNILLKNAPGKKFYVTRSIWDNYYNSLIGTGAVTEAQFENLQKGLTTLTYKGIPVIPVDLWDVFLAESDNPLTGTTRHLILLTVKENHILGVEQGSDLNKIEGWYERKDRKFYYEADMKFGYNYLHCDLQTIAY